MTVILYHGKGSLWQSYEDELVVADLIMARIKIRHLTHAHLTYQSSIYFPENKN